MKFIRVRLENLLRVKRIVTCFSDERPGTYHAKVESHDFWEMVYVRRGNMRYQADTTEENMRVGEAIFHAPDVIHSLSGDGKNDFSFFIITFVCESPAMGALAGKRIHVPTPLVVLIDKIMEERMECFRSDSQMPLIVREGASLGAQQMIGLYLEQLLIGLLRELAKKGPTGLYTDARDLEIELAHAMREYLEKHIYDAVDMKQLCEQFHYGKSRLSAVFRNVYGESVMHWYLARKIEVAKQAILSGEYSIAEISTRLQFDSPQYFSRIFKRYIGVCPRDFRLQIGHTNHKETI